MRTFLGCLTLPLFVIGVPLGYLWGALSDAFILGQDVWDSHWSHS